MSDEAVFRIGIDINIDLAPPARINADTFPHLSHAVRTVAAAVQQRWVAFASGVPMPNGKVINNATGEYQRSIKLREIGDFAAEVFSVLPYAVAIELGSPARDMKRMLNSSLKVRLSKDGKRYLIIPFRHDVPYQAKDDDELEGKGRMPKGGSGRKMPVEVWNWWHKEGRESSHVTGTYRRVSGTGAYDIKTRELATVPGWRYRWGTRLGKGDLEAMGFHGDDKIAKRLAGMVNFRNPSGAGGSSHSQYITFRVMSEDSQGWIMPAREGLYPARTAGQELEPVARELFAAAVEQDIRAMLNPE